MKKVSLTLLIALFVTFAANAQLKNKKGEVILPETGDWAIGVDAAPVLSYFGNMLNGNTFNSMNWNFTNGTNQIFGKYFTSETEAYRVGLRIGFNTKSAKNNLEVTDSVASAPITNTLYVEDKATQTDMNIVLSVGKEYRKGHGRLQGFYGADAYLMFGSSSTKYTYGNAYALAALGSATETPNSTSWATGSNTTPTVVGTGYAAGRPTKDSYGGTFGFGVRAFIGAEYFVMPKMSIGGEFGWGLGLQSQGKSTSTTEYWDGVSSSVKTFDVPGKGTSGFSIDTDNLGGAIKLMFHF